MERWLNESESFVIEDDSAADWALRKVAEARDERDRLCAHLDRQREIAIAKYRRTEEHMSAALLAYFDTLPVHRTKTQESYALPTGKLVRKHPGVKYDRDKDKLVAWLRGNNMTDMVKTVYEPCWADLKPLTQVVGGLVVYRETGEVVDGVQAVEQPDEFRMEI